MAGEDLSVSTPTETRPSPSTGPAGIGLSSQNEQLATFIASRSPTETGPAAEPPSRLSPIKWTSTKLGSALESGSLPEQGTQSNPTEAASDPPGSDDCDPGYTDNDALCATCQFLLKHPEPDLVEFEGWEVKLSKRVGEANNWQGWSYECRLATEMTWSGNLKSSLFNDKCPLCRELLCCISSELDEFFQQHPTRDKIIVVKSLHYQQHSQFFWVQLVVHDKGLEHGDSFEHKRAGISLYPEHENESLDWDGYSHCRGYKAQLLSDRAIGNPGPFESNTGSDLSWQLVRAWMAKCLSSHKTCNQTQPVAPPLPTRVIDVGSTGGKCPPRLHEVTDKESGRYATSSHRWGSQEMLKLEVNNHEDLKREIPWERLPKTFQDAIEATRRLGIRYIWIDSLCIIQDSPNGTDWAAESAKMTSVYENSYINFAATDATNSTQGCFFDRNPSLVRPVRLHIDWPWAVEVEPGYYYAARSHRFADNVAPAPLYQRGWVFQERTLAPRIIHCCSKQLYWECLESIASESFPTGLPHYLECVDTDICVCHNWRKMKPPVSEIYQSLDCSSTASNAYFASLLLWNQVVLQYTRLDLTFERDKLVAISGLAKMHSRFLNTRYLAGMWLEHLPVQLLWYRNVWDDRVVSSYNEYIAPSWSWASIPHEVGLPIYHESNLERDKQVRPIIQILDATVDLVDENHPFGAVSGGALRIKGPLANSSLIKNFAYNDSTYTEAITYNGRWAGVYQMDTVRYHSQLRCKKPVYSLPVILDMYYLSGSNADMVSGLLIQENERGENIFQRVGVFCVHGAESYLRSKEIADGIRMLQEACRSQNGPDDDGPFPEWGMFQTITLI